MYVLSTQELQRVLETQELQNYGHELHVLTLVEESTVTNEADGQVVIQVADVVDTNNSEGQLR